MYFLAIVVGVVGAFCGISLARKFDIEQTLFGWALIGAAFWYIGFGLFNGQDVGALAPQFAAGAVFTVLAILGLTKSIVYIGLGWVLHVFWDYTGPLFGEIAAPWWTAPACLGFDVIVGIYLLAPSRGIAPLPQAIVR